MVNMQSLHSFGLNNSAKGVETLSTIEDVEALASFSQPYLILGQGTNTVFVNDYLGHVFKVDIKGVDITKVETGYRIKVGAGEDWHKLVEHLVSVGINGLENLALIPGSVGAAPVQNIGAYGAEFADYCVSVTCYDVKNHAVTTLDVDACQFGYRDSIFKKTRPQRYVILFVELTLPFQWSPNLNYKGLDHLPDNTDARTVFDTVMSIRQQKLPDPKKVGNAGSFFKNPVIALSHYEKLKQQNPNMPCYVVDDHTVKIPAAWLIDQCGFKGKRWGSVICHQNQPLVLANQGKATGAQLLMAAREIKKTVLQRFDVELENEVRLIGASGEVTL